jgi:hypothetical protein
MRKRALLTGLTGFGRIYRIGGGRLARGEGVINTLFGVGRVGEGEMEGWRDGWMEGWRTWTWTWRGDGV